jgi:CBS-domain-containing membrane protein
MIKITKPIIQKALIAGFFSAFTIGVLTVLTYKSTLGYFLAGSFGSSMVLLFGFPESPFAQPKNVFFGHLLTGISWDNFCKLYTSTDLYKYCTCSGCWCFFNDFI